MPIAFVLLLTQLSDRSLDAKSVALLGMLAALLNASCYWNSKGADLSARPLGNYLSTNARGAQCVTLTERGACQWSLTIGSSSLSNWSP